MGSFSVLQVHLSHTLQPGLGLHHSSFESGMCPQLSPAASSPFQPELKGSFSWQNFPLHSFKEKPNLLRRTCLYLFISLQELAVIWNTFLCVFVCFLSLSLAFWYQRPVPLLLRFSQLAQQLAKDHAELVEFMAYSSSPSSQRPWVDRMKVDGCGFHDDSR